MSSLFGFKKKSTFKKNQSDIVDKKTWNSNAPQTKTELFEIFKQHANTHIKFTHSQQYIQKHQIEKFSELLSVEPTVYADIQRLSWDGIPHCIRAKIWKYLLKYIPANKIKANDVLDRKRAQYFKFVQTYLPTHNVDSIENQHEKKMAKIIQGDVLRTLPEAKLVRQRRVQQILTRALYIWHIKHPASGYVQGINDIVIPFFLTYVSQYVPVDLDKLYEDVDLSRVSDETLGFVEADIYWSISKMLDTVATNYVRGFGGIKEAYKTVEIVLKKVDPGLYEHMMREKIDLFCLSFREISTFLLRMFSPKIGIRLFDTLISYEDDYPTFVLFLLVAIFVKFSRRLMKVGFDEIMKFMQQVPTKSWRQAELQILISEAYVYKQLYTPRQQV